MLHYLLTLFPLAALLTKRLSALSTRRAHGHMRGSALFECLDRELTRCDQEDRTACLSDSLDKY